MSCQFTFVSLDATSSGGSLLPQEVVVRGVVTCAAGAVTSVTITTAASPAPVTASPGFGGQFSATLPIGGPLAICGGKLAFSIVGNCADGSTCRYDDEVALDCGSCARAALSSSAAGCVGGLQPITLSASISIPAGQVYQFRWLSGIAGAAPGSVFAINNAAGNQNTVHVAPTALFSYPPGNYLAQLVQVAPPASECAPLQLPLTAQCISCPTVTGSVTVGPCDANLQRNVTFDVAFSPPVPAGATATITYVYGGLNAGGVGSTTQVLNTSGPVSAAPPHIAAFTPQATAYFATAVVSISSQGQTCPTVAVDFHSNPNATPPGVWLATCQVCPQDVHVVVTTPPNWCVPLGGPAAGSATLHADVVWPVGGAPRPKPSLYDWTVTLPNGTTAKSNNVIPAPNGDCDVSSHAGWTGAGASASGGIDVSQVGNYAVSVVAKFATSAGLPTQPDGTPSCNLTGSSTFALALCTPTVQPPCPDIRINAMNGDCADPAIGKVAALNFAAQVTDPAGVGQGIEWDFGDPGSPNNVMTTPPGVSTVAHNYAAAGSYLITAHVRHGPGCRQLNGSDSASLALTIDPCPSCPPGQVRDSTGVCVPVPTPVTPPPPPMSIGCWILLIAALLLGLVACVLGIIAACSSNIYVGIAAGIVAVVSFVLLGLWLGFCARGNCGIFNWIRWVTIWILMIAPVVGVIVGLIAGGFACGVFATVILWGYWGAFLAILDIAGPRIPCALTAPPFP